jgi:acetoin utilization deacetylase AcuC-like enzyme
VLILAGPSGGSAHDGGSSHPERPARIDAVMAGVEDLHLGDDLVTVAAPPASPADLARVHTERYLDQLEAFCSAGGGNLDPDTFAGPDSWEAATRAAGAGIAALNALEQHRGGVAFVAVRPPGHHARADQGMGFCLLNNVAVAAASLTAKGARVLIVDWDVHHGNGTQAIFWNDPGVLYLSTHQWPLYPGTGEALEVGGPGAPGLTVNIPVPPGATGDVLEMAFERVGRPAIDAFAPDWVLVSCGFDAHRADPLGQLELSSGDFARLARLTAEYAPQPGRLALFLEGGYDATALRTSVTSTLDELLGGSRPVDRPTNGGPGRDHVEAARATRRRAIDLATDEGVDR